MTRRGGTKASSIGEALAVGGIVLVAFVALFVLLFAFSTTITALIVALAWNVLNLHEVFGAEALSFWEVVGVAVAINILRSIFGGNRVSVNS